MRSHVLGHAAAIRKSEAHEPVIQFFCRVPARNGKPKALPTETDQTYNDRKANGVPGTSTHTGRWRTRQFFVLQDERGSPGEHLDT